MLRQRMLSDILTAAEVTRDREREQISKILHDETGGQLMAAATELELLRMDGVAGLDPVLAALDRAFESVRMLSRDVHPHLVKRVGLSKALQALCASGMKRFSGELRAEITPDLDGATDIYRIAEELLDNAIRHSRAGTIYMVFSSTGELMISDNGVGFDPHTEAKGLGLLRVRLWGERAHLRVRIRAVPESGTMIRVTQPHAI